MKRKSNPIGNGLQTVNIYINDINQYIYLFLMKNLYSQSSVMMKNMNPMIAIHTRFLDVNFHSNGDFILSYNPEYPNTCNQDRDINQ